LAADRDEFSADANVAAGVGCVYELPIVALFLVAQRSFVQGIARVGIKG
jgi:ABC-type maltose transport system permease subunit